jgi:hypothetical protein
MTASEFEVVLKEIDPRFSVVDNPNRPGLSNVFFLGKNYDLPALSTHDIRSEIDMSYRYEFPNGMLARFWSQGEIIERVKAFLDQFNSGKYAGFYED